MFSSKIILSCVLVENGISFTWHLFIISVSSVDFLEQELLPFQNIWKTEATFNFLHGMDAILIVLCEYLEGRRNHFLPIPQTINFDLIFLWVQYSVFNWTICSCKTYSEDTMKWKIPTILLFFLMDCFLYKSFLLFLSQPPAHFQFESVCAELPALVFTVTFSAKLDFLKISTIGKNLTSWSSHISVIF